MKRLFTVCWVVFGLMACLPGSAQETAIVIHGGAGVMSRDRMSDEAQKNYMAKLNEALTLGDSLLKAGVKGVDMWWSK